MKCPFCNGDGYTGGWDGWTEYKCDHCDGTGKIEGYKLFLDFKQHFPKSVRESREFYIRTCQTEKLIDIIYNLIRWDIPIPGVFMDNTDTENKKFIEIWLREKFKDE